MKKIYTIIAALAIDSYGSHGTIVYGTYKGRQDSQVSLL